MTSDAALTLLGEAIGDSGRAALAISEELLDALVVLGERSTQDAVDDLVDDAAGVLRELSATSQELTLALAGAARRGVSSRQTDPAQERAPRPGVRT